MARTRTDKFDETTAFFRDVLGLSLVQSEPGFSVLQLPCADRDYVEGFGPSDRRATLYSNGPVVGLLVEDLDEARQELEAAGVELLDETHRPESADGYGWFHFRAPDGNVYAVLQGSRLLPGVS